MRSCPNSGHGPLQQESGQQDDAAFTPEGLHELDQELVDMTFDSNASDDQQVRR